MTGQSVRSLPIHLWPIADRSAWEEVCRPSVRLKRGGAASHMRNVTQNILAKRGYFFDFLWRSGRLEMDAGAGAQVTPENVEAYVAELKGRVRSVTVYGSIQKLRRIVQLVAPHRDLDWLIDYRASAFLGNAAALKMGSRRVHRRSGRAGLKLMAELKVETAQAHPRENVPQWPDDSASCPLPDSSEELCRSGNRPQFCQC